MCWKWFDLLLLWPDGEQRSADALDHRLPAPAGGFVLSAHGWMLPCGAAFLAPFLLHLYVQVNREEGKNGTQSIS